MAFVLSRFCSTTLRTLCEAKDVGYSCDFSKNSSNLRFWYNTYKLLDSISRSIESPIGLHNRSAEWLELGNHAGTLSLKGSLKQIKKNLRCTPVTILIRNGFNPTLSSNSNEACLKTKIYANDRHFYRSPLTTVNKTNADKTLDDSLSEVSNAFVTSNKGKKQINSRRFSLFNSRLFSRLDATIQYQYPNRIFLLYKFPCVSLYSRIF